MRSDLDHYLAQRAGDGLSPKTITIYRLRVGRMLDFVAARGVTRWPDVTAADLQAYMMSLFDRGMKQSSRFGIAETIVQFFRALQARGRVLRNPSIDLPVPEDRHIELPTPPLEEAEVNLLFERLSRRNVVALRNRLHIDLLYSCGMRVEESLLCNLDDIDLGRRTVLIHGKFGHERVLPLYRGVMGSLRDYIALRRSLLHGPDHGALLLTHDGRRIASRDPLATWLRKVSARFFNGRRLHPHLFRHSIAVHMLRGGADIRYIQAFLGHQHLDTTKVYLRLVPGRLKDEYDEAMPEIAVGL